MKSLIYIYCLVIIVFVVGLSWMSSEIDERVRHSEPLDAVLLDNPPYRPANDDFMNLAKVSDYETNNATEMLQHTQYAEYYQGTVPVVYR